VRSDPRACSDRPPSARSARQRRRGLADDRIRAPELEQLGQVELRIIALRLQRARDQSLSGVPVEIHVEQVRPRCRRGRQGEGLDAGVIDQAAQRIELLDPQVGQIRTQKETRALRIAE
jgi:hypothetical protein